MLWPLSVVLLVANTNGRLAIPALAGLLVCFLLTSFITFMSSILVYAFMSYSLTECTSPNRFHWRIQRGCGGMRPHPPLSWTCLLYFTSGMLRTNAHTSTQFVH